jgi:membrane-bound serine protease (ClpP class)
MTWLDTQLTPSIAGISPLALTLLLIIAGMTALAAEIIILPGFGIAGIVGGLTLIGGVFAAWHYFGAFWGGVTIVGTIAGTIILTVFAFKSKTLRKRFVLETQLGHGGGTESQDRLALKGKRGITITDLRPSGMAEIDGERIDVVSEGGFIERGQTITVVEIEGPRIIVAPVA